MISNKSGMKPVEFQLYYIRMHEVSIRSAEAGFIGVFCFPRKDHSVNTTLTKHNLIRKITYCGVLIALGMVLPFLTGQIPEVGSALSPLHIPALIAGFTVGPVWGTLCAFVIPILRSAVFGMPHMFPMACTMAFEMAAYAAVGGILWHFLPKKPLYLYLSQIGAMVIGRAVYGAMFALFTVNIPGDSYTFAAFIVGCFVEAVPGIVLHLVLVPPVVMALRRAGLAE